MTQIRAFVGHSFTAGDEALVQVFLAYFDQMKGALSDFDWTHAKAAQPTELAAKVLKLTEGKNVFIGICSKRERVVADEKLRPGVFDRSRRSVVESDLSWKTSDWVIQEIGLAIGRGMDLILLVEEGCRKPGGLQGDIEFISFDRQAPERAFGRLLEMMKALSPQSAAGEVSSGDAATESSDEEEVETASKDENDTPDLSWDMAKYESAFFWKMFNGDTEGAKKIDDAFASSALANDEKTLTIWRARSELWRIRFGEEGALPRLRKCHEKFPSNPEISNTLANGLAILTMHDEAAKQFVLAAQLASDDGFERERLNGLAAVQYTKAGNINKSEDILKNRRTQLKSASIEEELDYLQRYREIASDTDNKMLEIEILERIVQITPDDWNSRFNLAYRYSQIKMRDMSLFHYTQIPHSERSAITWNNLGVAYQEFSMPAKAVEAYRTAASRGETLAMSNLAYKLMQSGFTKEADEELQNALNAKDFHRNVGEAVSALKDIPDEEDKKLKEALKQVESKKKFFQELGRAISSADIEDIPPRWSGPNCDLALAIKNGQLAGSGGYESQTSGLSGLLGTGGKTVQHVVQYKGTVIGRRVIGTLTDKRVGDNSGSVLGLGSDNDEIEFAMVIEPDGQKISVMERPSSASPKFYTLEPKSSLQENA